jgi:SPP1 gp7 family putative phage head morphogenesis protein
MSIIQRIRTSIGLDQSPITTLRSNGLQTEKPKKPLDWKSKTIFQTRKDIKFWKRAKNMALHPDEPNNVQLQLLYTDIMDDGMLESQIGNRTGQLMSMPFALKNAKGETDEEQTKILKESPFFRMLTREGLNSVYYGYSVIQFIYDEKGKLIAELIPRTNLTPQNGYFYPDANDVRKIKYRELPEFGTWILEYNSGGLGLIDKAVPPVLFSRFATSCWSELCEIYGIPPRVIKTNTTDATMLARAEQMMKDMGSAAWFIIDEEEDFQFADNVNTKGEVFENLIRVCDNRICLIISGSVIGQDTQFGNKGKEAVAQDLLWYRVQDDMDLVQQQWNNINLPALIKHGIIKDGLTFEFEQAEDIAQLWKFTSESMPYYDFEPEWLKNKFGIEVKPKAATTNNTDAQQNALSFFLNASEQEATHQPCCTVALTMSLSGKLNNEKLIERYWEQKGERKFDAELFNYTALNLTEAFSKGVIDSTKNLSLNPLSIGEGAGGKVVLSDNIGITYGIDSPLALTAYEMNLFRFAGAKTLAESQALNRAFRLAKSFDDFRIRAGLITKIHNTEWLRTEYQTAMAVGESSATYYRLRSQLETFPFWQYRTVGDEKVREEHAKLDGLILRAESTTWQKIYPPNGWNCRCFVVPRTKAEKGDADLAANESIAEAYIQSEDFEKAEAAGWGVNRAETREVFTANQQYITDNTEIDKLLSELSPADYNIKPVTNPPERNIFDGTAEDYFNQHQKDGDLSLFDYNNRELTMPKKFFDAHTSGDKEFRKEFLSELENILQKPDEVWFRAERKGSVFNQFLFVKTYKDMRIAVVSEINKKGLLKIKTWFELANEAIRWGLLIK